MPLTDLERFRATVAHEKHGGILFGLNMIPDLDRRFRERHGLRPGESIAERFGLFAPGWVGMRPPSQPAPDPHFERYFQDMEMPAGAFINYLGVLETPGGTYHFTSYTSPLRNAASLRDLESFPYPSSEGCSEEGMAEHVDSLHSKGQVVCGWVGHMYEDAWQVRGYEPFLMDMALQPEWAEYILDRFMERNLIAAKAAARAGVDMLRCGDDVANQRSMMFSLEHWRHFMKPRWARVWQAAREIKPDIQIFYHSDGNIAPIIAELIEIGVTILDPVQPECLDPVEVKRLYGKSLTLHGSIGTQSTMPFGTPAEVRRVVRERVETLGYDGALILGPTHVLEPEVPLDNIDAYIQAAADYGR